MDFANALQMQAEHCDFGMMEDDLLTSRLCNGCSCLNVQLKLLQEDKLDFDKSVKLATSVESVECIGSSSVNQSSVSRKSVPVAVQTEPSSCLLLLVCISMQTDSVSSRSAEQMHNSHTQTNPVLVPVSRCAQIKRRQMSLKNAQCSLPRWQMPPGSGK